MEGQDPFVPMFAMLVIMILSFLTLVVCCWRVCANWSKQRREKSQRQRLLEEIERTGGGRASLDDAYMSVLESRLRALRQDCINLLDSALFLKQEFHAFKAGKGLGVEGFESRDDLEAFDTLEKSIFRISLVVFSYVQMLHQDSPLAREVTSTEQRATSAETSLSTRENERVGNVLTQLDHRGAELKNVLASTGSICEKLSRMKAEEIKQNTEELIQSMHCIMKNLADIVRKRTIKSPDTQRRLMDLLRCGITDTAWGAASSNYRDLRTRAENCREPWVLARGNSMFSGAQETKVKSVWFPLLCRYRLFFGLYWLFLFAIFVSWLARIEQGEEPLLPQRIGNGGFGVTFFGVPDQYDLGKNPRQAVGVPIVYGFMHCALFSLGLLPLTMIRGVIRDLSYVWPGVSNWIPTEHFVALHINLGLFILALLACGATTWMIVMLPDCLNRVGDSCLAFAPDVKDPANPVQNVMTLRFIVWSFWFPFLPLLYWAKWPAPKWIPACCWFFRVNWFEFAFYAHITVAYGILILALVARFYVFWPMLISWPIYFADRLRETFWRPQLIHLTDKKVYSRIGQPPNSMHLTFELKASEECDCTGVRPRFPVKAGQWVYILIPSVDWTWHPFSISSEQTDRKVELHIGIRTTNGREDWVKRFDVYEQKSPTWTYKLMRLVQRQDAVTGYVRGPYGTTFDSCYNPKFGGAVVIGAGTGITAAESILRENIRRRRGRSRSNAVPNRFWFVWSCRCASDLTWCFDRVLDLLVESCEAGILNLNTIQTAVDKFDWLGVAVYVTRTTEQELEEFRKIRRDKMRENPTRTQRALFIDEPWATGMPVEDAKATPKQKEHSLEPKLIIQEWLLGCIHQGSLDLPSTHVLRYLQSCFNALKANGVQDKGLAVGYCGPPALARTLAKAVQSLEAEQVVVHFSADHQ